MSKPVSDISINVDHQSHYNHGGRETIDDIKEHLENSDWNAYQGGLWFYINSEDKLDASYLQELAKKFTMEEIEENGLQDCEKEEVTDNE